MTLFIAALCAAVIRPLPNRVQIQMNLDGRASREQGMTRTPTRITL